MCWRLWIIPVTVLYTALPILLWHQHELLGENLFFASLMWAFAGWVAFVHPSTARAPVTRFWWFFVPFAAFILTKPAGRFAWPGILVGLVDAGRVAPTEPQADRRAARAGLCDPERRFQEARRLAALYRHLPADGPRSAAARRLQAGDSRPGAAAASASSAPTTLLDTAPFEFLENPATHDGGPLWQALSTDAPLKDARLPRSRAGGDQSAAGEIRRLSAASA